MAITDRIQVNKGLCSVFFNDNSSFVKICLFIVSSALSWTILWGYFFGFNAMSTVFQMYKGDISWNCTLRFNKATVLPAKSDSDVIFRLQSYLGLRIDRSLVYLSYPQDGINTQVIYRFAIGQVECTR